MKWTKFTDKCAYIGKKTKMLVRFVNGSFRYGNMYYDLITMKTLLVENGKSYDATSITHYMIPKFESEEKVASVAKVAEELAKHWTDAGLGKVMKITEGLKSIVKTRLKEYSLEDMKKAVTTYATVYKSPRCFYTWKFQFAKFLKQSNGMAEFFEARVTDYESGGDKKDFASTQKHDMDI
jgi:hypothetical protein